MAMLEVHSLSSSYGDAPVLHDVVLEVQPGETIALMGRNGVGKTTLLRTVMGLLPVRGGRVRLDGEDITTWPSDRRARAGLGYVPQGRDIFPYLTVAENLHLGARRTLGEDALAEVFQYFPALAGMMNKKGGVLSGGEQQQLAIARVLLARPKVLLLDEPTEGIQPSVVQQIEGVVHKLKQERRMAILLIEQYLDFALRLADSFYVMEKGSIVTRGTIDTGSKETIQRHMAV
jgi:urea transport system ATP-binding protein